MCCSVLQYVAVHCGVLQCVAAGPQVQGILLRHSALGVLQCVAVCSSVLQCAAVCCSALQCVAVCCSVLQCVAVCWSVLQCTAMCCSVFAVCCSVLQCVAVWCSVLQCVVAGLQVQGTPGGHPRCAVLRCTVCLSAYISVYAATVHITATIYNKDI